MKSDFVVVFTKNNARILKGVDIKKYANKSNCVINPDLAHVLSSKLDPRFWKLVDGKIVPMNEDEIFIRKIETEPNNVDNMIKLDVKYVAPHKIHWKSFGLGFLSSLLLFEIIHYFLSK